MATLSKGQTFGASETITNSKLHNLVDLGSISGIVNADIDASAQIADSKLADITTGNKVRQSAVEKWPFKAGDWILSSVTTARTGWTNVSATYANKFMRISATPLTLGGADTHSHTLAETNLAAHTHAGGTYAAASDGNHTHSYQGWLNRAGSSGAGYGAVPDAYSQTSNSNGVAATDSTGAHTHSLSGSSGSVGSGTAFTGDNVPAYVQTVIFQMDA